MIPHDKEVDALNKQIHAALVQHMVENPDTIGRCLHLMVVSKSLSASPTTRPTWRKTSFISAKRRTSGTPA